MATKKTKRTEVEIEWHTPAQFPFFCLYDFFLHSRPRHNGEGEAAYKGATQDHNFPPYRHSHLEAFFEKEEKRDVCSQPIKRDMGEGGRRERERREKERKGENEKHVPRFLSRLGEWFPSSHFLSLFGFNLWGKSLQSREDLWERSLGTSPELKEYSEEHKEEEKERSRAVKDDGGLLVMKQKKERWMQEERKET